jgi:hypothetical protein
VCPYIRGEEHKQVCGIGVGKEVMLYVKHLLQVHRQRELCVLLVQILYIL